MSPCLIEVIENFILNCCEIFSFIVKIHPSIVAKYNLFFLIHKKR